MTLEATERNLSRRIAKSVAPPPDLKISEWADRERRLSAKSSPEPGRWNTDRAPYQREPMDCITDPEVRSVVLKWSAQVGKSEILLNAIGYFIHQDPAPMLLVDPTLELAESFSKDRIAPMISESPALSGKVGDARTRDSGNTLRHKEFPGGHLTLAGANSPASLASRPVRIVLLDEVDRFARSAGTEGDPVKLAQKRSENFYNRKTILASTPLDEGASRIDKEFKESDQRFFQIPCPLCDHYQRLVWEQIKYETNEAGAPINVRYTCSGCGKDFDDSSKLEFLQKGKWVATGLFKGIAGFHLSALYSPFVRWEKIVTEYLEAGDDESLKVWTNTGLGETWKVKGEAPEWKRLYDRREKYSLNTVPRGGLFLTCGVDVQKDRLELEVVAWGRDKQSWSIDYRVLPGDTATEAPWTALNGILSEQWKTETGFALPVKMLAVDSGFNTQHVYTWARTHPMTRVMAIKGRDDLPVILGQPTAADVVRNGRKIKRGFRYWPIGVNVAKSELYSWLRLETPSESKPFLRGFCHFPEYSDEFFKMLTAEQIVLRKYRGFDRYEWVKVRERNESLDCRVYARAAANAVGMDRFTPDQWDAMSGDFARVPAAPSGSAGSNQKSKDSKSAGATRRRSTFL